tara:strand:+ start:1481 stop:2563 length:1083 start_codon:yes stop_codon:yes gene_type:complete
MPTNADVLNFAQNKLIPEWTEQFYQHHPVLDKIILKGNIERNTQGGPYLEFPVVTNGPGQVTRIDTGSEIYSSTRRTVGARGQIYCPRMIYSYIIPGKDLAEASGETAIARLIKVYPEAALMEFHEQIVKQLVTGAGSSDNVDGFLTLNGDTTFNPQGSSVNGILDFAAASAQNETVLGLAKEGATSGATTGWFNQYQQVSSFATNGRKQMRRVYWDASLQGKSGGPCDLMIGDIASFNNYYDDLDDQVRYQARFDGEKGRGVRQGLMFQEAEFYVEPELDTSASTFTSRNGVIYFLKSDSWHIYTQGEDSGMETRGDFAMRGPTKVPGQDAWEWEIVLSMQMYCDRLNANGVVDGTANA